MITQKQHRGFILAIKAGEIMMKSGGEIYRVEDTITRICRACDIPHIEVFATPTGIFASIGSGGEDGDIKTYIKSIPVRSTDLQKISSVNSLSREFVSGNIEVEDAIKKLKDIENDGSYKLPLRLFGASLASSIFCYLFGGSLADTVACIFIGAISYLFSTFLSKYKISYFIIDFMSCGLATFLALLVSTFSLASGTDFIVIGVLMLFVPGAAITNALRDFLTGDMLSGVARLTEALAISVALALGAGFVLKIWLAVGGIL